MKYFLGQKLAPEAERPHLHYSETVCGTGEVEVYKQVSVGELQR